MAERLQPARRRSWCPAWSPKLDSIEEQEDRRRRASSYLGIPNVLEDEERLEFIRTVGDTAPVSPVLELEDTKAHDVRHDSAMAEHENDTAAWLSMEQAGFFLSCLSFASGGSVWTHIPWRCNERQYQPTLLGLPAELRNQIWKYTLLQDSKVLVSETNHWTPSITRASQQLREESLDLFLMGNVFTILIDSFNPVAPENFFVRERHRRHWLSRVGTLEYSWTGQHSWANLFSWLKVYHVNGVRPPAAHPTQEKWLRLPCHAFDIVDELKAVPWENVRVVLDLWKASTEAAQDGYGRIIWT